MTNDTPKGPLSFLDCATQAIANPELVENFNCLTGCNLGQSLNRTAFEIMFDRATGYSGESEKDLMRFLFFVHDCVWCRLPEGVIDIHDPVACRIEMLWLENEVAEGRMPDAYPD